MDFLSHLIQGLSGQKPQGKIKSYQQDIPGALKPRPYIAPEPRQNMHGDPMYRGYLPEITYNPNPNTNIPYSTHNMDDAILGNEYTRDPRNPKFLGVDPKRFGYPPDNGFQYAGQDAMDTLRRLLGL